MNFSIINGNIDISDVEKELLKDGLLVPLPAKELAKFGQEKLSLFCVRNGIYQLPSEELIQFLKKEIGDLSKCIEVGAGNGCIGRAVGIKMTDNWLQTRKDIKDYYETIQQVTITYGEDVEKIEALSAFNKYMPEVVVGCWITERVQGGVSIGHIEGVREKMMFDNGLKKYIHVGNHKTHQPKLINPPAKITSILVPEWLFSRSMSKGDNAIYIFES